MQKTRAILPCAGFGSRMKMASHESKEMLEDPVTGKYLIDYHLDLCKKYDLEPIVITRLEKEKFNEYIKSKNVEHIVLSKPGIEWPDTVLKSQGLWSQKNILFLPDTRIKPESIIQQTIKELETNLLCIVTHEIPEGEQDKWGIVTDKIIYEKPTESGLPNEAWGIIGFDKFIGEALFKGLSEIKYYEFNEKSTSIIKLETFKDITRSGKIENYE